MSDQVFDIEHWAIEDVRPYTHNAKVHPDDQVEKLAASIARLGWSQPIIVDANGIIIAGHGRRLAAIKLGLKKVPVICRRDLTTDEANALRLADNKMASIQYDAELLTLSFEDMSDEAKPLTGYDEKEWVLSDEHKLITESQEHVIDDIAAGLDTQRTKNEQISAEVDERALSLVRAFGFSKVTTEQARKLKAAMIGVEHQTGLTGADALVSFFDDLGY